MKEARELKDAGSLVSKAHGNDAAPHKKERGEGMSTVVARGR